MTKQIQIHIPVPVDKNSLKWLAEELKGSFGLWGIETGRVTLADVGSEQVLLKIEVMS